MIWLKVETWYLAQDGKYFLAQPLLHWKMVLSVVLSLHSINCHTFFLTLRDWIFCVNKPRYKKLFFLNDFVQVLLYESLENNLAHTRTDE